MCGLIVRAEVLIVEPGEAQVIISPSDIFERWPPSGVDLGNVVNHPLGPSLESLGAATEDFERFVSGLHTLLVAHVLSHTMWDPSGWRIPT